MSTHGGPFQSQIILSTVTQLRGGDRASITCCVASSSSRSSSSSTSSSSSNRNTNNGMSSNTSIVEIGVMLAKSINWSRIR